MSETTATLLAQLQKPLDEIAEKKFRDIVAILEAGREQGGAQRLLDQIRPRLRRVRPPRRASLRRLFYGPVEDLLEGTAVAPESGRIARGTMALVWPFVSAEAPKSDWAALQSSFASAGRDREKQHDVGKKLWPLGAIVLQDGIAAAGADREIRRRLTDDVAELMPELSRIAVLLSLGEDLQAAKVALPSKPIRTLTDDHLIILRDLIKNNADDGERAGIVLQAIAARMAVPAELIQHVQQMSAGLGRTVQLALVDRLQNVALADIDRSAKRIEEAKDGPALDRADLAKDLVQSIAAMQDGAKVEGSAKKELTRLKSTAERAVSGVVDDAGTKVGHAVEVGPSAPVDAQIEAENNLLALRKCQGLASTLGLEGKVSGTLDGIAKSVRQKAADLMSGLGSGQLPESSESPETQVFWAVRMLELAGNADEADKLRRDGMALIAKNKKKVAPVTTS